MLYKHVYFVKTTPILNESHINHVSQFKYMLSVIVWRVQLKINLTLIYRLRSHK